MTGSHETEHGIESLQRSIAEVVEQELPLDEGNPVPFKQPFLILRFADDDSGSWEIDVDGKIDLYLNGERADCFNHTDLAHDATELLNTMIQELRERGREVVFVGRYRGSAGPSHVLRHGAFFERMKIRR